MRIIKDRQIVEDSYEHLADDVPVPEAGAVSVSLERLARDHAELKGRGLPFGVRIKGDTPATAILPYAKDVALIAIEFPKFADGRGYTLGRLLRERHGYKGELRATGNVLRDQMFYMSRCGFDAFELTPGKSLESALGAFSEITVAYQPAADEPLPLFRRRFA